MIGAFLGAFLGGLISYLITNFMSIKSTDVAFINNHMEQLTKLEVHARNYWLNDEAACKGSDEQLAALVNGAMTAGSYFEDHASKILTKPQYHKYTQLDGELFDLITGDTFETARKEVDCQRVIQIMTKCNEIRGFLATTRRSIFWAR